MSNWLYKHIMGDDPTPERSLAKLPIVDDDSAAPERKTQRTAKVDRLIEEIAVTKTMSDIFGYDIFKSDPSLDNTRYEAAEPVSSRDPVSPMVVRDPRKPACACDCAFCRSSDCINCCADEPCSQSSVGTVDASIQDIKDTVEEIFAQAARERKQKASEKKTRKSRVDKMLDENYSYQKLVGQFR
jgi:hypothetical protein